VNTEFHQLKRLPPLGIGRSLGPLNWLRLAGHSVRQHLGMFQKFVVIAAWSLLGFVIYATLSPIAARPTFPALSSVEHLAAFAALGGLFCIAYPRQLVFVCILVFGSAVLLEIAQLLTPDRHARLADALQKVAGGALGIAVVTAIRRLAFARNKTGV
jgi:VanZ family protein